MKMLVQDRIPLPRRLQAACRDCPTFILITPLRSRRRDQPGHDLLGQLRRHHGAYAVDVPVRVQLDQVGAGKPARKFLNDLQHLACRQPARLVVRDTGCKSGIKRIEIQRKICLLYTSDAADD